MPTNNLDGIKAYLIRAVLFTYFQSGTTSKLQQMKSNINNNEYEITVDMLEQMSDLRVTDGKIDDIINSEKGSRVAGEALYFLGIVSKLLFICLMATRQVIGILLLSIQMIQLEKIHFSILLQREILITAILKAS